MTYHKMTGSYPNPDSPRDIFCFIGCICPEEKRKLYRLLSSDALDVIDHHNERFGKPPTNLDIVTSEEAWSLLNTDDQIELRRYINIAKRSVWIWGLFRESRQ